MDNVFDLNDWRVLNLETSKTDEVDDDDLSKGILHGIKSRMSDKIMKINYGAMRMYDPATDGYYIVE